MNPTQLVCKTSRALLLPLLTLATLAALPAEDAHAQGIKQAGRFGIGLGSGTLASPISMKYFMSDTLSVQGNVGFHRYGGWYGGCSDYRRRYHGCGRYYDALGLGADLLLEKGPLVGNSDISLDWEIGGGVGLAIWERAPALDLAAAFVLGLQLNVHALPIDVVLEYRPKIYLTNVAFDLVDFTGHIRYYF